MTGQRRKADPTETWLTGAVERHSRLSPAVASLITNILHKHSIPYLSISHRTKTVDGALEKLQRKSYSDPTTQLTDISGVRVVTYLEKQADAISAVMRKSFSVDERNSSDQSRALGSDRVGYRSQHLVCSLGPDRDKLPEYAGLGHLPFEIQIRTALQHAWAELSHDNAFKLSGTLPDALQRKLNLHSAMLEIVDGAFQEIFDETEQYRKDLSKKPDQKLYAEDINKISLERYLTRAFKRHGAQEPVDIDQSVAEQLKKFGLATIGEVAVIVEDAIAKGALLRTKYTAVGLLRLAMVATDFVKFYTQNPKYHLPTDWRKFLDHLHGEAAISKWMAELSVREPQP